MSRQDNNEESQQSLVDKMEMCENNSLRSTKLSDFQDTTIADVLKGSTRLPNGAGSDDDTASKSEAVDPNNRDILVEFSHPRVEEAETTVIFNPDLPGSTCGRSDSEASSSTTYDSSEFYSFLEGPSGLAGLYSKYAFHITRLRNRGYLLPFEMIWLAFAIACCYMGAYHWPMCPADVYIPRYVFFNGAIATFSVCVEIMDSLWKLLIRSRNDIRKYFCAFVLGWVAIITTLIEMTEFYTMSYSFHRNEENYCNETFYCFVYYKNIAFGVLVFLSAIIYIPSFDFYYYLDYI
ncbi:hypothetical protein AVEN_148227-1 [Araneus ventricosus]|uniref:Uncharacterized protein n=1 Tax=Araneus ventricosus TaxID=182803 RepID=A0A4Y2IEJ5_ARAVE|nr:hypothetical protein AVEN_148227-1 [Araneus ventricosus]